MPGRSQKGRFGGKSSGRVPKADDQSERYDCKKSLSKQAQSARMSAWRGSVLAADAKKAGSASEDTWEAGLKPLFVMHWMADLKSESKRSDECA